MRISDWSSDVCSSDLAIRPHAVEQHLGRRHIIPVIFRRVSNGLPHLDEAGVVHHCIRPNPAQDSLDKGLVSDIANQQLAITCRLQTTAAEIVTTDGVATSLPQDRKSAGRGKSVTVSL